MIERTPWFERRFDFDLGAESFPLIVERLRGTPARLEDRLPPLPAAVRTRRRNGGWSIQENAGHLLDLEPLWLGRVEEVLRGEETMRAADLTNRATHEAGHNHRDLEEILGAFRASRQRLVTLLDSLGAEEVQRASLHPRLGEPMRVLDLAFFVAEHDDHHLARITELLASAV